MNFPTLTQGPDITPFEGGALDDPTIRTSYESGARRSRNRQTVVPKIWMLQWSALTAADKSTLLTFESDSVGYGGDAFSWANTDDGSTYEATFSGPIRWSINMVDKRSSQKRYEMRAMLEEYV